MSFEIFDEKDIGLLKDEECAEMFSQLRDGNYAVSNLKASKIRHQARLQGYKVSVRRHPRATTYIVKLVKSKSGDK